jgi:hypothetical protein
MDRMQGSLKGENISIGHQKTFFDNFSTASLTYTGGDTFTEISSRTTFCKLDRVPQRFQTSGSRGRFRSAWLRYDDRQLQSSGSTVRKQSARCPSIYGEQRWWPAIVHQRSNQSENQHRRHWRITVDVDAYVQSIIDQLGVCPVDFEDVADVAPWPPRRPSASELLEVPGWKCLRKCKDDDKISHIGINYPGTSCELHGCVNDAENLSECHQTWLYVQSTRSFLERLNAPISWVISRACKESIKWRLRHVFISYSGHGVSVPDQNGDEVDGSDECCPSDYQTAGILSDDVLKTLFSKFFKSTKITVLMDCCHSGSILDLHITSVPLNRIFKHQLHVIQKSWFLDVQTLRRYLIERGASKPVQWPPLFWIPSRTSPGPGKCLPSDYVYADFAEGTPYVPDTSAGGASSLKLHLSRFVAD